MKILKKENGSITLFVLIAMLFFAMFLVGMYILNANAEASGTSQTARIKEIYEEGLNNIDDVYSTLLSKAGTVIKIENNIKYTSDGEGNQIPVPVGFSYLEGTKESGFVIKNDNDKNEFVWIPTDLVEYKTYDWNKGKAATEFTEYYTSDSVENTKVINEISNSVDNHKGYYISRYEAGVLTKRTSETTNQVDLPSPVFKATSTTTPVYAYNYVNWYDAIYIANNLYSKEKGNNVTSRLINARGWDTALKFIETVGQDKDITYPADSTGKGWYEENASNNANYETGKSVDLTNVTVPNRLKNMYDMAGNVFEWTSDIYTSDLSLRALRRW